MKLTDIRRWTPAVQEVAYFQSGGLAPKPQPVVDETIRALQFQNQGPALPWVNAEMTRILETVRGQVGKALNADPDEIMLCENATVGINVVGFGIDWQRGDNIILTSHEHPGNRIPWYAMVQRFGIELRFLTMTPDEDQLVNEFQRLLDSRTRLVSISHVSRRTGQRLPVRRLTCLAHQAGTPVLIDGAQAWGAIPVDVKELGCDFYSFCGHKYIMGPQGTGGLYVRRDRLEWLKPSWLGSHSQAEMDLEGHLVLHDAAKRFEFGTRNLSDQAGLGKALEIWEAIGWKTIYVQIETFTDRLKLALQAVPDCVLETPWPYQRSSAIVTFRIPGIDSRELASTLLEHDRVLVSTLEFDSERIRLATHVFNTEKEIERLIDGLIRVTGHGQ